MIFLGDIAAPNDIFPRSAELKAVAKGALIVANLEGALSDEAGNSRERRLFNHPSVLTYLQSNGIRLVSLANNHVFDLGPDIGATKSRLAAAGISAVGAGASLHEAEQPAILTDAGRQRVILAFGWTPIQCRPAGRVRSGVNPLETRQVLESVDAARRKYRDATIVLLMHWDYELEVYPMPMHRELAFRAIDRGADAVVGCHSHCVQGAEIYKGAPIVYGLGNWFLAQGLFFGGKLRFPEFASTELAFEWTPESGEMLCHWFKYSESDHSLKWASSEPLADSDRIARLTPFAGMGHIEYGRWFRDNRRKKSLLPVYTDPDAVFTNRLRNWWVAWRQVLISAAFVLRLKGGPR